MDQPTRPRRSPGGWVIACVCGTHSGPRATKGGAERWAAWHRAEGCEGCDHVTSDPTWVKARPARTGPSQEAL